MDEGVVQSQETASQPSPEGIGSRGEQIIALPTGAMLAAVLGGPAVIAAGWMAITIGGGWTNDIVMAGPVGAGVVAAIAAATVLMMTPWKPREMSWWMTLWLGSTVVRLFVTPLAAWLLYSAASLEASALMLALASAYLVALFLEAVVIARRVYRSLPA